MKLHHSFIVLLFAAEAFARSPLPLMPPRDYASHFGTARTTRIQAVPRAGFGLEVGTVGRGNSTKSEALGLQLLYGGRLFARIPFWENFFFKPSLGYFRRGEGVAQVGVMQHSFELGATVQYTLSGNRHVKWLVGVAQRMEMLRSSLSVYETGASLSPEFRYRIGPTTGVNFRVDANMSFIVDIEYGMAATKPSKHYGGLSAGFVFGL